MYLPVVSRMNSIKALTIIQRAVIVYDIGLLAFLLFVGVSIKTDHTALMIVALVIGGLFGISTMSVVYQAANERIRALKHVADHPVIPIHVSHN